MPPGFKEGEMFIKIGNIYRNIDHYSGSENDCGPLK